MSTVVTPPGTWALPMNMMENPPVIRWLTGRLWLHQNGGYLGLGMFNYRRMLEKMEHQVGSCWPGRKGHMRWELTPGGTWQLMVGSLWRKIYFQAHSRSWQNSSRCGFVTIFFLGLSREPLSSSCPLCLFSTAHKVYTCPFTPSLFHDSRNTSTLHQKQNTLYPQPCLWELS